MSIYGKLVSENNTNNISIESLDESINICLEELNMYNGLFTINESIELITEANIKEIISTIAKKIKAFFEKIITFIKTKLKELKTKISNFFSNDKFDKLKNIGKKWDNYCKTTKDKNIDLNVNLTKNNSENVKEAANVSGTITYTDFAKLIMQTEFDFTPVYNGISKAMDSIYRHGNAGGYAGLHGNDISYSNEDWLIKNIKNCIISSPNFNSDIKAASDIDDYRKILKDLYTYADERSIESSSASVLFDNIDIFKKWYSEMEDQYSLTIKELYKLENTAINGIEGLKDAKSYIDQERFSYYTAILPIISKFINIVNDGLESYRRVIESHASQLFKLGATMQSKMVKAIVK